MRSIRLFGFGLVAFLGVGAMAEHFHEESSLPVMGAIDSSKVVFRPAPVPMDWIVDGHPVMETAEVGHTGDGSTKIYVWRTTAGKFNWYYDSDEFITILDGEVFVSEGTGTERRFGQGDVVFFPVGTKATWRVPDHLRKIAVLKRPLPGSVASLFRWAHLAKSLLKPEQAFASD